MEYPKTSHNVNKNHRCVGKFWQIFSVMGGLDQVGGVGKVGGLRVLCICFVYESTLYLVGGHGG